MCRVDAITLLIPIIIVIGGKNAVNLLYATHTDKSLMFIADRNMLFEYKWCTKSILNKMLSELNIKTVYVT